MPNTTTQTLHDDFEVNANANPVAENRRIYVVDDEVQVLEVIEMQLTVAGFDVVTFDRPSDFLDQAPDLPQGVVISDQRMPEIDGLTLQKRLREYTGQFQMILLSGFPETSVAVEAMKQGAVTVLDKPYNKQHLISSVEEAFAALSRAASDEHGLPPVLPKGARYLERLSNRERQVIELVYAGQTNKSIAIALGISIKTIEKHRGKGMKKMSAKGLAELIRLMDRELGR